MLYKVWMEGFVTNGERAKHSLYGEIEASTFKSACKKLVRKNRDESIYNEERNAVWGCRLFEHEEDSLEFDKYIDTHF